MLRQSLFDQSGASRRDFLKGAGMLIIGFSMTGSRSGKLAAQSPTNPTGLVDATQVDSWIVIGADESVTAYSGKCEFGQGFSTVQTQLVAEELFVPLNRVNVIFCDTGLTPDQGVTSGSQSHPTEFGSAGLRQALATARDMLFQMASQYLNVPMSQLTVKDGVISAQGVSAQQVSYGQLIQGKRFNLTVSSKAVPKDPAQYTVLGTSVPRLDIPTKVTGQFQFVQNVRVPGMLHGRVVRPPAVGATVLGYNPDSVAGLPGSVQVVVKKNFVGVVADTEWHAMQAAAVLDVQWSTGDALPNQQAVVARKAARASKRFTASRRSAPVLYR
jgi:nicotinate dehydrogenase subunit B